MISIIYSCSPERARKILNGEATLDIRKIVPKDIEEIIKEQGGIWVYMYVTKKQSGRIFINKGESWYGNVQEKTSIIQHPTFFEMDYGGKVVARWWFDEYDTYYLEKPLNLEITYIGNSLSNGCEYTKETKIELLKKSCLTFQQIWDCGIKRFDNQQSMVYALHIKRLEIFEKPMELGEFYRFSSRYQYDFIMKSKMINEKERKYYINSFKLQEAPKSWQYVWVKE
jgi:predicted transcriptional regulator